MRKTPEVTPQAIAAAADPDALLPIEVVCALTDLRPGTIREMVRTGRFPAPVHINRKVVRWVAGQVRAWLQAQATPDPVDYAARLMGETLPLVSLSK